MRIRLNLTPQTVLRLRETAGRRRTLLAVPVIAALVVASVYGFRVWQERQARQAIRQADEQISPVGDIARRLGGLLNEIQTFDSRRQEIQAFLAQQRTLSVLLEDVSRLIPQNVWLQSLKVEGETLTISGSALDRVSVAQFTISLSRSRVLGQVQLRSLQQGATGARSTQFLLTARLR